MAKFLANVIKPIEKYYSNHTLTDTFDFVDKLRGAKVTDTMNTCLASLDIVSLFTNVPIDFCLQIIKNAVTTMNVTIDFDIDLLIDLLRLCVCDVQFLFNGAYYRQTDGVAMGSPLGPILANICVGFIEAQVNVSDMAGIVFYGRYVDDIFVVAKNYESITTLAHALNSVHENIKFTIEYENDSSLPFLDVRVDKKSSDFYFSWYHKSTWTASFLHYHSFVPHSWKIGLLKSFKYRLLRICSTESIGCAIDEVTNAFIMRGYPRDVIKKYFIDYFPMPKKQITNVPKKPVSISIPFLGDERTLIWKQRIKKYVESVYPAARVVFYIKTTKIPSKPLKDKLSKFESHGVVYHFNCECSAHYVGRTERNLGQRIREHIPAWLEKRKTGTKTPDSAITKHLMCCTEWKQDPRQNFKILHQGANVTINRILEAIEISNKRPPLCTQKDRLYTLKIPWT